MNIKRIISSLSIVLLLISCFTGFAQCTIDTTITNPAFTPATMPCITAGIPYGQSQQIYVPATGPGGVTIDSVVITSISGLPTGISYTINPASGVFYGNTHGCVWYSGTTSAATGLYLATTNGTAYTSGGNFALSNLFSDSLSVCGAQAQLKVFTIGRDPITTGPHNFNLYGVINSQGDTAHYKFVYSTDSTFAISTNTPLKTVVSNSLSVVWGTVSSLVPASTYYYYLTATSTLLGTVKGSTLKFYSDTLTPYFEIYGADVYPGAQGSVANLNGKLSGFTTNLSVYFQWGLKPVALNTSVISNAGTITDANQHNPGAFLTGLVMGQTYFYRMMGITATDTIYSDIRPFYIDSPYSVLQTLHATSVTTNSADLGGLAKGFPVPLKLDVEYGEPYYGYHTPLVYVANDTALYNFSYSATQLQSERLYGYRFKAESWLGNFFGNDNLFITGNKDSVFQTLPATGIIDTAATFNGFADNISFQMSAGFQYGTTTALSNYIQTDSIGDTLSHSPAYRITGLLPNTTYYYCLRAGFYYNNTGPLIYGDTLQFTTGPTGLSSETKESSVIKFYPNPVSSKIHFIPENNNEFSYLKIYAIDGRELLNINMQGSNCLDVSAFESGIYFIQTFDKSNHKTGITKFVKQ